MASLEFVVTAVDRILTRAMDIFIIAMAGLLLVLLNYAVVARFILNASVSWGEELPAHILAALTFIGAAYLTRSSEHLGFDSVARMFREHVQRVIMAVNMVLMGGFGLLLAYYGGIAAASFGGRLLISVDLPMALFRGAMPVGGALIALICAVRLVGLVTGRVSPDDLMPESDA
jgi:TRAP-type transport system small permease protein